MHNEKQHEEFYIVRDKNNGLEIKMDLVTEKLNKIETSLEEVLSRLPLKRRAGE